MWTRRLSPQLFGILIGGVLGYILIGYIKDQVGLPHGTRVAQYLAIVGVSIIGFGIVLGTVRKMKGHASGADVLHLIISVLWGMGLSQFLYVIAIQNVFDAGYIVPIIVAIPVYVFLEIIHGKEYFWVSYLIAIPFTLTGFWLSLQYL